MAGRDYSRLADTVIEEHTTGVIQRYLDELAGDSPAEPIVREFLERAAHRLHVLCANLLYRSYPRLTKPPLNLETEEMLGGVVEGLLKAMRSIRPQTVRQFFALANQHMRWQLNDLARRLDEQPAAMELQEGIVSAPASSGSGISANGRRMLDAIDKLPDDRAGSLQLGAPAGANHHRGRQSGRCFGQDGATASESCTAVACGRAGRPATERRAACERVVRWSRRTTEIGVKSPARQTS